MPFPSRADNLERGIILFPWLFAQIEPGLLVTLTRLFANAALPVQFLPGPTSLFCYEKDTLMIHSQACFIIFFLSHTSVVLLLFQ